MQIRTFIQSDKEEILKMVDLFYNSPGILHTIPVSNFADAYDEMVADSGLLRGLTILKDDVICGYCQLTFCYSTEAGGRVVWLEEFYIKEEFRGKGIGNDVLEFLADEYRNKAARLRLEAMPDNIGAMRLYAKHGYKELSYTQFINENF